MEKVEKVDVFISYSHEDKPYLIELLKYLEDTNACPNISIWKDTRIEPGEHWDVEIKEALDNAEIVLLLISQDFLISPYIRDHELSTALRRSDDGVSVVFPVFIRDCNIEDYKEITKLQGYPSINVFIDKDERNKDTHYKTVARKVRDIANKLITNTNVKNSIAQDRPDQNSAQAAEIERLRTARRIFLSLPISSAGRQLRRNFIVTTLKKIKHDIPKWPYEVIPTLEDAEISYSSDPVIQEAELSPLLDQCIYYIHIIGSEEDLLSPLFRQQYELVKSKTDSQRPQTILWFLDHSSVDKLESLDDALKIELKQLPHIIGENCDAILRKIDEFDAEKEKRIIKLSRPFSPLKKVLMLYDSKKDGRNNLRRSLRKKIQESQDFTIRELIDESSEEQKKEIEECSSAIIFYGPDCGSEWYKAQETFVRKMSGIRNKEFRAVLVDGKDEEDIESKIDYDVSVNEFVQIKGEKELELKINDFKKKLLDEK